MKNISPRQRIRFGLLVISLLLFPITMNYLSPYIILYGASQGIINGSLIMFFLLFFSSLIFGRLWCSWICPAGGLGEVCMLSNGQTIKKKWLDSVKWVIWIIWLGLIAYLAFSAGGYRSVNFFLLTESGISVDEPAKYMIYLIVVGIFAALSLTLGRRAG
jgi:polyferredoxin